MGNSVQARIVSNPASRSLLAARRMALVSPLAFAFLFPFLTWTGAAGCAILILLFDLFVLPQLGLGLTEAGMDGLPSGEWAYKPGESFSRGPLAGIILSPIAILALVLFFPHHLEVVAGAWTMLALGDAMADVAGVAWPSKRLAWNAAKTWSGFAAFIIAGALGAFVLTLWIVPTVAPERALCLCLATAAVGALAESLPIRLDDNISVPLVSGAFMFCALLIERSAVDSNLPYLARRIFLALAINAIFAAVAYKLKTIDFSGAAVGFLIGVATYLGYGYKSFVVLAAFFVLGSIATRMGGATKLQRGIAERRGGLRSWREVLGNSLVGAFCSILVISTHFERIFLVAMIAAFAEAAGDTVSSEVGKWLSEKAYLIGSFRAVPAGENGGISLPGTVAGFAASAIVAAIGLAMGLTGKARAEITLAAAIGGNLLDSLLGATLERRGLLTNSVVNFFGTSFAAGLAVAMAFHLLHL